MIATDIGHGSWEEVNIIRKGENYGWAEREGPEQVFVGGPNNGRTGSRITPAAPFPSPDTISVEGLDEPVRPIYPAAAFSHRDGASIGSGFVYRGKLMRPLTGKYIFTDIVTGRLFYSDFKEMQVVGGRSNTLAPIYELQVVHNRANRRIFDIVADAYARNGGAALPRVVLPGLAGLTNNGTLDPYGVAYAGGRADVRLSVDADGELYLLSKTDGMIRKLMGLASPPPSSPR